MAVLIWLLVLLAPLLAAHAQAPVAVVEEIDGKEAGVDFMDYLTAGQVIKLAARDRLTISYLTSCRREVISGGTIVVGTEQSLVTDGNVDRQQVRCDSGRRSSTTKETTGSGAMVFRKTPQPASPHTIVYALSPMFVFDEAGELILTRVDKAESNQAANVVPSRSRKGLIIDLEKANISLSAGGLYRAQLGRSEIIFRVDPSATPGPAPIVSRLLRLPPAR